MDIADPLGEIEKVYTGRSYWDGVKSGLKQLQSFSRFNSWQMYHLNEENLKLKTELEHLSDKIKVYEGMVKSFKSTSFFENLINDLVIHKEDQIKIEKLISEKGLSVDFLELWNKAK